jgi:cell division protein ZapA (FtsZ GTPase activity inhibitor)
MTKMKDVAEQVAGSVLLTAVSRVMMAIGVPVTIMVGAWVVKDLVALGTRIAVIEQGKPDLLRRLEAVERQNQRDIEEASRLAARFSTIEARLATLVAQQSATLRGLDRVERVLDGGRATPRP